MNWIFCIVKCVFDFQIMLYHLAMPKYLKKKLRNTSLMHNLFKPILIDDTNEKEFDDYKPI